VAAYFFCDGEGFVAGSLYGVARPVPAGEEGLRVAIEELLSGPTEAEREQGYSSTIAGLKDVALHDATVMAQETAVIDVTGLPQPVPEEARSFLQPGIMAELTWTVFKLDDGLVNGVEFQLDGSCDAFWQAMGADECQVYTRQDWEQV
jgi:hypothetical protein